MRNITYRKCDDIAPPFFRKEQVCEKISFGQLSVSSSFSSFLWIVTRKDLIWSTQCLLFFFFPLNSHSERSHLVNSVSLLFPPSSEYSLGIYLFSFRALPRFPPFSGRIHLLLYFPWLPSFLPLVIPLVALNAPTLAKPVACLPACLDSLVKAHPTSFATLTLWVWWWLWR